MTFFTSGAFWFVEGVLAVLAGIGLKVWMEDRNTPMPAWKWLLVAAWLVLLGFTIAFIGTSVGEKELVAAEKGGILFSVVCIITGAGLWRLLQIGRRRKAVRIGTDTATTADQAPEDTTGDDEA